MKDQQNIPGKSRRRFLNLGILFGLGLFTSSKVQAKTRRSESGEKVRVITADGQVMEVDKSHIPNFERAKPVSDAEFRQWKETEG